MERRIDRLEKYMIFKKLNDNQVTNDCGLSIGLLNQAKRGKSDLGNKSIEVICVAISLVFVALLAWYLVRFLEEIHNVSDAFNNIADAIRHEEHEQDEFESKVKDFIQTFTPKR